MGYADATMLVCVVLWVYPTLVPRDLALVPVVERSNVLEDFGRMPVFESA